jgi:hypothetical protein
MNRIARSMAGVFLCWSLFGHVAAQQVISTKAGIIDWVDGEAFLDREPLVLPQLGLVQMEKGQMLRTGRGYAELLLAGSAYLRTGENASLKLEQNQWNNTQLSLEQGSALIEIVGKIRTNPIRIRLSTSLIKNPGLYRLDHSPYRIRVYRGSAVAEVQGKKIRLESCRQVLLAGDLMPCKFDVDIADVLHRWAAQRSFKLFAANPGMSNWTWIDLGWFNNCGYRMRFHLNVSHEEWIRNRQLRGRQDD